MPVESEQHFILRANEVHVDPITGSVSSAFHEFAPPSDTMPTAEDCAHAIGDFEEMRTRLQECGIFFHEPYIQTQERRRSPLGWLAITRYRNTEQLPIPTIQRATT